MSDQLGTQSDMAHAEQQVNVAVSAAKDRTSAGGQAKGTADQFVAGAGPLRDALDSMQEIGAAARAGELVLDEDVAPRVRRLLQNVLADVDALVKSTSDLDQPLSLGNNFVASVVDRRFRQASVGEDSRAWQELDAIGPNQSASMGLIPILKGFRSVVHGYERAVMNALMAAQSHEDDLARGFKKLQNESTVDGG